MVSYQRATGVVAAYDYAPCGAVTSATGSRASTNPFRFSSEFHDDTLGLVYYNYRHYNPIDGRWLGRDILKSENDLLFLKNEAITSSDLLGMASAPWGSVSTPSFEWNILPYLEIQPMVNLSEEPFKTILVDDVNRAFLYYSSIQGITEEVAVGRYK